MGSGESLNLKVTTDWKVKKTLHPVPQATHYLGEQDKFLLFCKTSCNGRGTNLGRKKCGSFEIIRFLRLLFNGDSVFIIEFKYQVHPRDIETLIKRKGGNFPLLFSATWD